MDFLPTAPPPAAPRPGHPLAAQLGQVRRARVNRGVKRLHELPGGLGELVIRGVLQRVEQRLRGIPRVGRGKWRGGAGRGCGRGSGRTGLPRPGSEPRGGRLDSGMLLGRSAGRPRRWRQLAAKDEHWLRSACHVRGQGGFEQGAARASSGRPSLPGCQAGCGSP